MGFRIVPHPVDLQDREGFLAYLNGKADEGWELARYFRGFGVFRRTEETIRYSLDVDPRGGYCDIPGVPEGIRLSRERTIPLPWEPVLAERYERFFPMPRFGKTNRIKYWLLTTVALGFYAGFKLPQAAVDAILGAVVLCVVIAIGGQLLDALMVWLHGEGIREAHRQGVPYRSTDRMKLWTRIKNIGLLAGPVAELITVAVLIYGDFFFAL